MVTPEITELPEGMGNAANYIRAKGGGLGDISAALISYLHRDQDFELHVALPKYDEKIRRFARATQREVDILKPMLHRKGIHLIQDSMFSELREVYDEGTGTHPRVRRAEALQRYVINQLLDDLYPSIVHCNDWMTGLIPAAAKERGIRSLFTVHNVFTEKATPAEIDRSGIPVRRFMQYLYFESFPGDSPETWTRNRVDLLCSGIHAADIVNTVSPSFLQEIVDGQFEEFIPAPVRHAIREKHTQDRSRGILNAPSDLADPTRNPFIRRYGEQDLMEGKRLNKVELQRRLGLESNREAPLFFWPSRLYVQKGPELLAAIAEKFVREQGGQIALIANGARETVRTFRQLALRNRGRIVHHDFDEPLSELAKAGADFILMPSRYEPCGLPQMEGPRFGTLPVVRLTGGLKDTVTELSDTQGNGFTFAEHTPAGLAAAMQRAVEFHRRPAEEREPILQRIMREGFSQFSLANTAQAYMKLYRELLDMEAA